MNGDRMPSYPAWRRGARIRAAKLYALQVGGFGLVAVVTWALLSWAVGSP